MGDRRALQAEQRCPECDSATVTTNGETICEGCGLVLNEQRGTVTPSPSNEGGVSESNLLPAEGLTTKIEPLKSTAAPSTRSSKRRQRLRKWQHRIRHNSSRERNLGTALNEINRVSSALGIPDVTQETASIIYQRALEENQIVGWSIEAIATAAVYIACRKDGLPQSLEDVATVSKVSRRKIGRARRHLDYELGLGVPPLSPEDYLSRYCSELDVDQRVEKRARIVLEKADDQLLSGRSPCGLAGAAVYLAAKAEGISLSQADVSAVADVAVNTVSRQSQALPAPDADS